MANERVLMYGTTWCGQCHMARRYFDEHHVQYEFIDIDRAEAGRCFVEATNHGLRSVPTIVFPDGSMLVEPNRRQLATKLGFDHDGIWRQLMSRR